MEGFTTVPPVMRTVPSQSVLVAVMVLPVKPKDDRQELPEVAAEVTVFLMAEAVLAELSGAPDETWALRSDEDGTFLVYGYRLGEWGKPRPPFSVRRDHER